jgi:hypothetical protein
MRIQSNYKRRLIFYVNVIVNGLFDTKEVTGRMEIFGLLWNSAELVPSVISWPFGRALDKLN